MVRRSKSNSILLYTIAEASLKAHAELLAHGTEAKPNVFKDVLKAKNYQEAAQALQKDGYATDPNYANELIYAIKNSSFINMINNNSASFKNGMWDYNLVLANVDTRFLFTKKGA